MEYIFVISLLLIMKLVSEFIPEKLRIELVDIPNNFVDRSEFEKQYILEISQSFGLSSDLFEDSQKGRGKWNL